MHAPAGTWPILDSLQLCPTANAVLTQHFRAILQQYIASDKQPNPSRVPPETMVEGTWVDSHVHGNSDSFSLSFITVSHIFIHES